MDIEFADFPEIALAPNEKAQSLAETILAPNLKPSGKTFRGLVFVIRAKATRVEAEDDLDLEREYEMTYTSQYERDGDNCPNLSAYTPPHWPIYVEGKVLSSIGKDKDRTFMVFQDKKTSQDYYKVKIPLWNVTIQVPFLELQFSPGHFYFPAYKDSRVPQGRIQPGANCSIFGLGRRR